MTKNKLTKKERRVARERLVRRAEERIRRLEPRRGQIGAAVERCPEPVIEDEAGDLGGDGAGFLVEG